MSYLFDPDNWEWLTSGNNLRFILEGFLVNLEIAVIAIVFSLVVGLALALLGLSTVRPVSIAAKIWIDVFRNLPLIFLILYLALAMPPSWRKLSSTGSLPRWLAWVTLVVALALIILPIGWAALLFAFPLFYVISTSLKSSAATIAAIGSTISGSTAPVPSAGA